MAMAILDTAMPMGPMEVMAMEVSPMEVALVATVATTARENIRL